MSTQSDNKQRDNLKGLQIDASSLLEDADPFMFDDAIRIMSCRASRLKLIESVAKSGLSNWAYEQRYRIPCGTVDLATMAEDKMFQERNAQLQVMSQTLGQTKEGMTQLVSEYSSFLISVNERYPQGIQFMNNYAAKTFNAQKRFRYGVVNAYDTTATSTTTTTTTTTSTTTTTTCTGYTACWANTIVMVNGFVYANASIITVALAVTFMFGVLALFALTAGAPINVAKE
jgi:hypothetical protein